MHSCESQARGQIGESMHDTAGGVRVLAGSGAGQALRGMLSVGYESDASLGYLLLDGLGDVGWW